MIKQDWQITNETGLLFTFESYKHPGVEVKIFAHSEHEAWYKLERVLEG